MLLTPGVIPGDKRKKSAEVIGAEGRNFNRFMISILPLCQFGAWRSLGIGHLPSTVLANDLSSE
jgi:hypothetical protein